MTHIETDNLPLALLLCHLVPSARRNRSALRIQMMARTCVAALLLLVASVDGKARPITTPGDGCLSRLNRGHETTLDKGKPVMFAGAMGGEGGRGTAVCDVAAPPRCVCLRFRALRPLPGGDGRATLTFGVSWIPLGGGVASGSDDSMRAPRIGLLRTRFPRTRPCRNGIRVASQA